MDHQLGWEGSEDGGKWMTQLLSVPLSVCPVSRWVGWRECEEGRAAASSLTTPGPKDGGRLLDVFLESPMWSRF